MFCQKCGSENKEEAKFCVSCGEAIRNEVSAEQNNETVVAEAGKPPKKPKKKWSKKKKIVVSAIAALFLIIAISSLPGGDGDDTKTASTSNDTNTEESASTDTKTDTTADTTESYEADLTAGNYTAGIDIPAGTYDLTATSGDGNVSSSNLYSGGLNEIMGTSADSTETFSGAQLDKNVVLYISGNVAIHIAAADAAVSKMKSRTADESNAVELSSGNYTAGTDFPAGVYNVVATGSSGNVSSDNIYDGGLNEIMGTANDGMSTSEFKNAEFPDKTVLTISGTSVKLIPVTTD